MTVLDRRGFLKASGAYALAIGISAGAAPLLGGCGSRSPLRELQDMGGRMVSLASKMSRVFCTNPIGTVDVYCLAPDLLAGWNFKPAGTAQDFIPEEYLLMPSLGVWMGAGNTPNPEEIAKQDPDALLCFWTVDENGTSMCDEITRETAMPTLLVDYDLRSTPAMYRFLGQLLERPERADQLAEYGEDKIKFIEGIVAKIPENERKSIYLAQSTGGLTTDPVGSMHVTDALELIGVRNVADLPGTVGQGMGMPTVNIEQIVTWNPDAVLVSEYAMSDYQTSDLYGEITADDRWKHVPAVAEGRVFSIPMVPFSWFGRPPSVMRFLGCLMMLKLLYPDYAGDLDIREEARVFYQLFLDHALTESELEALLVNTGL